MKVIPNIRLSVSKIDRTETGVRKLRLTFSEAFLSWMGDVTISSSDFSGLAGTCRAFISFWIVRLRGL